MFLINFIAILTATALPASDVPQPAPTPKPAKEKKVCRPMNDTGTRLGRRECRSAAEWAELDERARAGTDELRRRAN